ncbi:MAG: ankyrin repeat domain-containing protein [Rickettsiales bacterium]|nr:MAG: ankyrin repeat domain-containing protein [Rickettsiales bacterium]
MHNSTKNIFFNAIKNDNVEKVKALLIKDKNLANAEDNTNSHRNTPLHVAAKTGNLAIAELLAKYGANPDVKNKFNKKASEMQENILSNKREAETYIERETKRRKVLFETTSENKSDRLPDKKEVKRDAKGERRRKNTYYDSAHRCLYR